MSKDNIGLKGMRPKVDTVQTRFLLIPTMTATMEVSLLSRSCRILLLGLCHFIPPVAFIRLAWKVLTNPLIPDFLMPVTLFRDLF